MIANPAQIHLNTAGDALRQAAPSLGRTQIMQIARITHETHFHQHGRTDGIIKHIKMPNFRPYRVAVKVFMLQTAGDDLGRQPGIGRSPLSINHREPVHVVMAVFIAVQAHKKGRVGSVGDGHPPLQTDILIPISGEEKTNPIPF